MDVTDLALRLVRRWFATTVMVLVAVLAAAAAWLGAGASEQSSAAVVIVPPTLGEAVSDQNPLLNLDDNLAQLATVLASAMTSQEVTDQLEVSRATAPFTISTITGNNPSFAQLSPQIVFTVTSPSAVLAERTSAALVAAARARLDDLQTEAGAPDLAKATLVTVVSPTVAVSTGNGRLRAAGAVGLGVGVLGLLGVLLLDEMLTRLSSRRAGTSGQGTNGRATSGRGAPVVSTRAQENGAARPAGDPSVARQPAGAGGPAAAVRTPRISRPPPHDGSPPDA